MSIKLEKIFEKNGELGVKFFELSEKFEFVHDIFNLEDSFTDF